MSWEKNNTTKRPCPCGKGEIEEVSYSDDWNRFETRRAILCPDCKKRYLYDSTVVYGHPGNETERGWVLKKDV